MLVKVFFTLAAFISFCSSARIQTLSGTWSFRDGNGSYVDLLGTVPGGIYSDLMENGIIGDILFGDGDQTTKWVPRTNWTYYTVFRVSDDITQFENINLVFDGLDTFANIILNDVKIGESRNMFVQYIFNVKNFLIAGENRLEVQFLSPIEVAENLNAEQDRSYNVPVNCPPSEYKGECHVNMIRKMQASFSWEWGPSFPSVGIWKDVYIEAYNDTVVRYVVADIEEGENIWTINVDTYLANNVEQIVFGRLAYQLRAEGVSVTRVEQVIAFPNQYNEVVVTTALQVPKNYVYYWWPNGYGGQAIYDLTVTFTGAIVSDQSTKTIRVGFRTVELVQETVTGGLTFYFKVNGLPIFAKGSNIVPIDILPERGQVRSTVERVLRDARSANMNMLRIRGGGVYESDYFYDLADQSGFLIWQDFMFASSMYPVNEDYLNNVVEEVRHQVKRLTSHPSIVVFAGNSGNEQALRDNWYGTLDNFAQYRDDYIKLYIDTIKAEFNRITRGKGIFIGSTPSNGQGSENEGYISQQPSSPFYGDVHFYNYYSDSFDSTIYPIPRFASEYGYQSLPSVSTFLTATNSISDININSDFMDHRQHLEMGASQLIGLIDFQFKLPNTNGPYYYKGIIYYSQIVQAMSVKVESEYYRRYRSTVNNYGQGNTMGALIGQLNDVWVAPTWSSVDFTGRWKMLHYFTTDFFAPMIVTGYIDPDRSFHVYAISDLTFPLDAVSVSVRLYKWDSFDPISEDTFRLDMDAGASHQVYSATLDSYLSGKGCGSLDDARRNCFIYLTMYGEELIQLGPSNYIFPDKIKNTQVQQANVRIVSIRKLDNLGTFEINIDTNNIALFVWLESGNIRGRFSINGFLEINRSRTMYFYADDVTISEYELQQEITVTHLLDPQYFVN